jgi:hypothetical protein
MYDFTSSTDLLGKRWPIKCSTHFSSASEVVACHRYKQLNCNSTVCQKSMRT